MYKPQVLDLDFELLQMRFTLGAAIINVEYPVIVSLSEGDYTLNFAMEGMVRDSNPPLYISSFDFHNDPQLSLNEVYCIAIGGLIKYQLV